MAYARPRTDGVLVRTNTGRHINLTVSDVQTYINSLAKSRGTISSSPYLRAGYNPRTGSLVNPQTVSRSEFLSGMKRLGYTDQQIHQITTSLARGANPSFFTQLVNSVAGAAPGVAPELPGWFSRFLTGTSLLDTRPSELPKTEVTPPGDI